MMTERTAVLLGCNKKVLSCEEREKCTPSRIVSQLLLLCTGSITYRDS